MALCVRNATGEGACDASGQDWSRTEVAAATFADARLHRRFAGLLRQLAAGVGTSIPQACGDWAGVIPGPGSPDPCACGTGSFTRKVQPRMSPSGKVRIS